VAGAPEPFDHDGRHYPGLTGISGMPAALQQPRPVVISAAYSDTGRDFAVRTSDFLLTVLENPQQGRKEIADIADRAERAGRSGPPRCLAAVTVVCRDTREAATAFHRYYAEENADTVGVDYYLESRQANAKLPDAVYHEQRVRMAAGIAGYPLIGSPQDVAEGLIELHAAGYSGVAMMFLNYLDDVPIFVDQVMPILAAAKLR
jgi:alkanesulfonate monooxygenase SsuD/methylene tetrahydromethanopterin reductase-like flavin-dependent oxidoreductase (luciferase family)